jgi:excisionase family DNA binding protein
MPAARSAQLELYTLTEAAELFHRSPRTVRRWVAAGEITTVTIGGQRRIAGAELARLAGAEQANVVVPIRPDRSPR